MISDRTLKTLGVVAAVLVILSAWVGRHEPTVSFAFNKGQLLIPDLDPERVDAIEVQHGEDTVGLRRAGASFLVESLRNYPASTKQVNTLLRSVLGVRCAAAVSEDPDTHAELRVAEGVEGSTVVRLLDADGEALVSVFVADAVEGQQFARLASSDTVYRTEDFVRLEAAGLDFVDKKLLDVKRDDIAKVEVAPAEGTIYAIDSPEAGTVELQTIPEGKKAKGTEPDGVLGAATNLNFSDFKSESDAGELPFSNTYTVTVRDEAVYVLQLAQQDDKWWVRANARYTGPWPLTIPRDVPPDATDEQRQANDEILKRNERLAISRTAVDEFNGRHQSWVYEIGSWKAESMTKALDDLLEEDDGKPEKVSASHILIPFQGAQNAAADVTRTREEAQALAEELHGQAVADPSQFATLAEENSSCPSSAEGGNLGEFTFEKMAKPFSEAAFALEVGAISEVVETEFGYHVIMRTQ